MWTILTFCNVQAIHKPTHCCSCCCHCILLMWCCCACTAFVALAQSVSVLGKASNTAQNVAGTLTARGADQQTEEEGKEQKPSAGESRTHRTSPRIGGTPPDTHMTGCRLVSTNHSCPTLVCIQCWHARHVAASCLNHAVAQLLVSKKVLCWRLSRSLLL